MPRYQTDGVEAMPRLRPFQGVGDQNRRNWLRGTAPQPPSLAVNLEIAAGGRIVYSIPDGYDDVAAVAEFTYDTQAPVVLVGYYQSSATARAANPDYNAADGYDMNPRIRSLQDATGIQLQEDALGIRHLVVKNMSANAVVVTISFWS